MSWDPVWEDIHANREWGKYPAEELIRFVARNYYNREPREEVRFLDLGCGNGSATWYLCREGFSVASYDGSTTAIAKLKRRLESEGLVADLRVGDATSLPYPDQYFDCVIDLACLMCNDLKNSQKIIKEVERVLKVGGSFFSHTPRIDCWGYGIGKPAGKNTFVDSPEGPFANMGIVRFCSFEDVQNMYAPFSPLEINYVVRTVNNGQNSLAFWIVTGSKGIRPGQSVEN